MFLRKGLCPLPKGTLRVYDEGREPETRAKPLLREKLGRENPIVSLSTKLVGLVITILVRSCTQLPVAETWKIVA